MNDVRHEQKVREIARSIREHAASCRPGEFFSLKKAAVSHTVPKPGDPKYRDPKIDIADLTEILQIDPKAMTCVAESGVTFETLVRETLKHRLVPMTVPELKTITIGGAVAGCSVESMSYKYGGFHDSCLEYELVTGTGEIIRCSPEKNADIFGMVHGSFGTLGVLSLLKFRLLPASPFICLEYLRFSTLESFLEAIRNHHEKRDVDFMDGIIHSPNEFILCLGNFVEEAPYLNRYIREIYYKSTRSREKDYLTTYDYFFRYDRECHWISRNFGLENRLLRRLVGPLVLGSSRILSLARRFPFLAGGQPDVIADVFIPHEHMRSFFDWYLLVFDYFPLWIVPYRVENRYPWINPDLLRDIKDDLFIDCAIYGFRQKGGGNYYRTLEEKVFELKGLKALITYNYYDERMFWEIYDRESYERVKRITDPQNLFRSLYQKTHSRSTTTHPEAGSPR